MATNKKNNKPKKGETKVLTNGAISLIVSLSVAIGVLIGWLLRLLIVA